MTLLTMFTTLKNIIHKLILINQKLSKKTTNKIKSTKTYMMVEFLKNPKINSLKLNITLIKINIIKLKIKASKLFMTKIA